MIEIEQQATEVSDPSWLQLLERLGLPIFLILFGCAIIWKLLPYVIEWFKQGTVSARTVAEAMPDVKVSLQRMADGLTNSHEKLEKLDDKLEKLDTIVAIDRKTDQILAVVTAPRQKT